MNRRSFFGALLAGLAAPFVKMPGSEPEARLDSGVLTEAEFDEGKPKVIYFNPDNIPLLDPDAHKSIDRLLEMLESKDA